MEAFHNNQEVKNKYLNRVIAHQSADKLIRGTGWNGSKGCAVGCTLEAYNHENYEIELGIPEWLARVEDTLFEGMSLEKSKTWPEVFLKAIPVGFSDWEKVKTKFTVMVLKNTLDSLDKCVFDKEKFKDVAAALIVSKKAVAEMIRCHENGLDLSAARSAARSARSAARSAADSAWSAARSAESAWSAAARSARSAESAWSAAESAARSAARSARSAARSARSAADSAAESAASSAESARSAAESAWSAAYDHYADELLKMFD